MAFLRKYKKLILFLLLIFILGSILAFLWSDYVNNTTKDTSNILGEWTIFKATENGAEIPLAEIYGTAINQYGGKLIFDSQGNYTEYIGVYSLDEEDDLKGKYEIKDNVIYLKTVSGKEKTLKYSSKEEVIEEQLDNNISIYFKR